MSKIFVSKNFFFVLVTISIIIGFACYFYFQNQPKVYKSSGKFSVSYVDNSELMSKNPYTSSYNYNFQAQARSLTEGIKSRIFVSSLLESANIKFDSRSLDNIDRIISSEIIDDSNIITVEIYGNDQNDINRVNDKFLNILNSSEFVINQDPKIQIKAVDPLYSTGIPIYPETIKYSLLATSCCFLFGCMLYLIFKSQKEQELYNPNYWN
jgi:hypothetical protein